MIRGAVPRNQEGASVVAQKDLARRHMSVEEWRQLQRTSNVKYEYSDGHVFAMAGGSADYSTIAINTIRAAQDALAEHPRRVYNSDIAVRLSPSEYRSPDATVTCDERDRGQVTEI